MKTTEQKHLNWVTLNYDITGDPSDVVLWSDISNQFYTRFTQTQDALLRCLLPLLDCRVINFNNIRNTHLVISDTDTGYITDRSLKMELHGLRLRKR